MKLKNEDGRGWEKVRKVQKEDGDGAGDLWALMFRGKRPITLVLGDLILRVSR